MSPTLNKANLASVLEFLASKGTQGPWRMGYPSFRCKLDHHHDGTHCVYTFDCWMDTEYWRKYIYRDKEMAINKDEELVAGTWSYEEGGIAKTEDAELIVTLINHLPQIIAALRKS